MKPEKVGFTFRFSAILCGMPSVLHITSGDSAGASLKKAELPGEVYVWHDVLYDGPRQPGWLTEGMLAKRAAFICDMTGGGLEKAMIRKTFHDQYQKLQGAADYDMVVLWFDACLFDQSMLCHILNCLGLKGINNVELLCVDNWPGINPYNGLGQLTPAELASTYERRVPVSEDQFCFARKVDDAFATQDMVAFMALAIMTDAPIPWIPAAVRRWLKEQPDAETGLGLLESLALAAIQEGCNTPGAVFNAVAQADEPPQYWGDTTLWAKINNLADRGMVAISGPAVRLPQWVGDHRLSDFSLTTP